MTFSQTWSPIWYFAGKNKYLPGIHSEEGDDVRRPHCGKGLPQQGQGYIYQGNGQKQVVQSLLLFSWAVTSPQRRNCCIKHVNKSLSAMYMSYIHYKIRSIVLSLKNNWWSKNTYWTSTQTTCPWGAIRPDGQKERASWMTKFRPQACWCTLVFRRWSRAQCQAARGSCSWRTTLVVQMSLQFSAPPAISWQLLNNKTLNARFNSYSHIEYWSQLSFFGFGQIHKAISP